jgi:hypothetical protein
MPKPADNPANRTHAYTVRFNDEENDLVRQAARKKALEVASWIRSVSFEAAEAQVRAQSSSSGSPK